MAHDSARISLFMFRSDRAAGLKAIDAIVHPSAARFLR